MFVLGMIGGFIIFIGIFYYFVLMSLVVGGFNFIGLGVSIVLGVMIGDSVMYFLGSCVKINLLLCVEVIVEKFVIYFDYYFCWVSFVFVVYGVMLLFLNDFVVVLLSMIGYNYWWIIVLLVIGNIFYNIVIVYFGFYVYDIIIGWFQWFLGVNGCYKKLVKLLWFCFDCFLSFF